MQRFRPQALQPDCLGLTTALPQAVHTSGSLLSSSNKNIGRSNKYKDVSTLFVSLYFILIFFGGVR